MTSTLHLGLELIISRKDNDFQSVGCITKDGTFSSVYAG